MLSVTKIPPDKDGGNEAVSEQNFSQLTVLGRKTVLLI